MNREDAIATYTGPDSDEICCANCSMLMPSNGNVWCDIHDRVVLDPTRHRCQDFEKYEGDDAEDSVKQEGLL